MLRRIALSCLLLLLLTACTAGRAPIRKQAAAPAPSVVTVKVAVCQDKNEEQMLGALVAAYQTANPSVRVDVVPVVCDSLEAIKQVNASDQYDVVPVNTWGDRHDPYVDLRPYMARAGMSEAPFGGLLEERISEGKLVALPLRVMPEVVWANKQFFAKAEIPLPVNGWTWEEFRTAASRLGALRTDGKRSALPYELPELLLRNWIEERTGRPFVETDDQTLKEGLTFFQTLVLADRTLDRPESRDWKGIIHCCDSADFRAGQAPLALGGLPDIATLTVMLSKTDQVVLPMPTHAGKPPVSEGWKTFYGVHIRSAQPDAAFGFLAFAAGPKGALEVARAGYFPAAPTDEVGQLWANWNPPLPPALQVLIKSRYAWEPHSSPKDALLRELLLSTANQVLTGRMSVDDAVASYAKQAAIIRNGKD